MCVCEREREMCNESVRKRERDSARERKGAPAPATTSPPWGARCRVQGAYGCTVKPVQPATVHPKPITVSGLALRCTQCRVCRKALDSRALCKASRRPASGLEVSRSTKGLRRVASLRGRPDQGLRFRAKRRQPETFSGLSPERHGQNPVWTA